jgi:hypothetical protein
VTSAAFAGSHLLSRCYLFEDGGAIKRIPRRVVEGLIFGKDALEFETAISAEMTPLLRLRFARSQEHMEAGGEWI